MILNSSCSFSDIQKSTTLQHPKQHVRQSQQYFALEMLQEMVNGFQPPGWFYNRSIHRLEFVASQTPLEPLALGDFKKSATAPEISH